MSFALAVDLRRAWLYHIRRDDAQARRILSAVAAAGDEKAAPMRLAAQVLLARMAREKGDEGATDRLVADIRRQKQVRGEQPTLVWSPPMPKANDAEVHDKFEMVARNAPLGATILHLGWVDLGFWIAPNGTVEGAEVLRSSRAVDWVASALSLPP